MNLELGQLMTASAVERHGSAGWRPRTHVLRVRLIALMALFDLAVILLAVLGTNLVRGAEHGWDLLAATLIPIYLFLAVNGRAYNAEIINSPRLAAWRGARTLAMTFAGFLLIAFTMKVSAEFSRFVVSASALTGIALIAGGRWLIARNAVRLLGGNPFSTMLICEGDQDLPDGDYSIVLTSDGYFDPAQDDPAMYDRLSQVLEPADRVVVVCPPERRTLWAQALKGANIQSEILVPELAHLAPLGVGRHGGSPSMIVANGPLTLGDRAMKRALDVTLAGGALLLLAPLLLITALCIKLHDGGPIFFKQTRIGRGNKLFRVYKFRSMRVAGCDSAGNVSTQRDDDRVTPIGRVIRLTSIDELPQLLNVLAGDMSIVGPRPHATGSRAADKLFWEVDRRYWHRHSTKPGLTGLAQVRGFRGATHEEADLVNRLQADLEYINNWSIWRDLKIIVMTFGVLLHRNAY